MQLKWLFLPRPSSDSPAQQQTPTYEEADGGVSAEPEPAAVET